MAAPSKDVLIRGAHAAGCRTQHSGQVLRCSMRVEETSRVCWSLWRSGSVNSFAFSPLRAIPPSTTYCTPGRRRRWAVCPRSLAGIGPCPKNETCTAGDCSAITAQPGADALRGAVYGWVKQIFFIQGVTSFLNAALTIWRA